jgi:hypothetical protein
MLKSETPNENFVQAILHAYGQCCIADQEPTPANLCNYIVAALIRGQFGGFRECFAWRKSQARGRHAIGDIADAVERGHVPGLRLGGGHRAVAAPTCPGFGRELPDGHDNPCPDCAIAAACLVSRQRGDNEQQVALHNNPPQSLTSLLAWCSIPPHVGAKRKWRWPPESGGDTKNRPVKIQAVFLLGADLGGAPTACWWTQVANRSLYLVAAVWTDRHVW